MFTSLTSALSMLLPFLPADIEVMKTSTKIRQRA